MGEVGRDGRHVAYINVGHDCKNMYGVTLLRGIECVPRFNGGVRKEEEESGESLRYLLDNAGAEHYS